MRRFIFIGISTLGLAACESTTQQIGPQVEERSADQVAGCTFLGTVQGIPKLLGPLRSIGQEDAERAAKREVQNAGGNVVVFDPISPDAEVFLVSGRAYSC